MSHYYQSCCYRILLNTVWSIIIQISTARWYIFKLVHSKIVLASSSVFLGGVYGCESCKCVCLYVCCVGMEEGGYLPLWAGAVTAAAAGEQESSPRRSHSERLQGTDWHRTLSLSLYHSLACSLSLSLSHTIPRVPWLSPSLALSLSAYIPVCLLSPFIFVLLSPNFHLLFF